MNDAAAQRPAVLLPFRWLVAISLALAGVAFVGGRHVYQRQGGYRPLALMHVPQTMRYRARVEVHDVKRIPLIAPLLTALDPRGVRRTGFEQRLGTSLDGVVREVAFGAGKDASEFVLVLGLQLQAGTGLPPGKALCEALSADGIRSEPTVSGCRLADGGLVAETPEGALIWASHHMLVKDLLGRPEIGDRMGFAGPSVRGAAPEVRELEREAKALSAAIAAKYR